jgi:hypothetical protein|tara:strand:- start:1230 stop:1571 length:342 start_codon:yes stop_codon:yes gene_type:complete
MMAMTPEAKVKKKVADQLKFLGAYYFYPVTGGYGRSGVPDIVGCYRGNFFAFECKSGKNKPTALQHKNLTDINVAGGISYVINEENMMHIEKILKGIEIDTRQLELDFPVQYE